MRPLVAALALSVALPGCLDFSEDPPPTVNTCGPAEPPLELEDGPYGSGIAKVTLLSVYPSYRSDYPKRLVVDRKSSSARIEYVHEGKSVVETWTMGSIAPGPATGACKVPGHEQAELTIASITVDGAPGELSRYGDLTATLVAGATLTYKRGRAIMSTVEYRHGFSPIFTTPCEVRRPVDGAACEAHAICAYDREGEHCTARCGFELRWQSYACN